MSLELFNSLNTLSSRSIHPQKPVQIWVGSDVCLYVFYIQHCDFAHSSSLNTISHLYLKSGLCLGHDAVALYNEILTQHSLWYCTDVGWKLQCQMRRYHHHASCLEWCYLGVGLLPNIKAFPKRFSHILPQVSQKCLPSSRTSQSFEVLMIVLMSVQVFQFQPLSSVTSSLL